MLHIKFRGNRPAGSVEEVFFKGFTICDSAWHFEPYGGIWSKL